MRPEPAATRLWRRIVKSDGCWEWPGALDTAGYGQIRGDSGRMVMVHRVAYESSIGAIPPGLVLDHLCRNRLCVRPDHLEPVTHRENVLRGEGLAALNAKKTRCPKDHPFDEENTYTYPNGRRGCRACLQESSHRRYLARKASA